MGSITAFLEDTLKLKVNIQKSAVDRPWKRGGTRLKNLRRLGIKESRLYAAFSRKGP